MSLIIGKTIVIIILYYLYIYIRYVKRYFETTKTSKIISQEKNILSQSYRFAYNCILYQKIVENANIKNHKDRDLVYFKLGRFYYSFVLYHICSVFLLDFHF